MTVPLHLMDFADGVVEGPDRPPRVPDGEYQARYLRHATVAQRQFGDAAKVYVWVDLYDAGEHTGKALYRSYRVRFLKGRSGFVLGRRSDLLREYAMVMETPEHRPRLDRINLRDFRPLLLRVRTRTVVKDYKRRDLPEGMRYSVVDQILGRA